MQAQQHNHLAGNLNAGLSTLSKAAQSNKQAIIKTLIGSMVAKVAVKTLSRGSPVLASLGPIKIRAMTPVRDAFGG